MRVLFAHWVTADAGGTGQHALQRGARRPTDRIATMRLRALWLAVGPFERLIGAEALALAAAHAERLAGRRP